MAKILIVDDEVHIRELLHRALCIEGYEVVGVPSAEQALELVFKEPFDLLLLDVRLSGESGLSILKKVRECQKDVPIVIYSGALTPELDKEARAAGANEVLSKDMDVLQLVGQIGKIIKTKKIIFPGLIERAEKVLLVVDDEEGIRRVLREFFVRKGYKVFEAENGEKALQLAGSEKISVVLLDIKMPGMDGLEALKRLLEINPKLGVVMTTAVEDEDKVKKALELGAYSYVLKPCDFKYLELVVMSKLTIAGSG
jgi:two-component system response regulator (stage 0 sporulation protein F)